MLLQLIDRLHANFSPFSRCVWETPFLVREPSFTPLPDLPLEIWLEIFQFATHVYGTSTIEPLDPFTVKTPGNILVTNTPNTSMRTKCVLVSVNRAWRRMALQILYQHIVIRSPLRATLVLQTLREAPEYGYWTRHIEIYTHARGSNSLPFLQTVHRILQYCSRLRMLSASWRFPLPKEFLAAVSVSCSSSLQGLYWDEQKYLRSLDHAPLNFLGSFKALHILDLRNFVGDSTSDDSRPVLQNVKHLILSNRGPNIFIASLFTLPTVHTLTMYTVVDGQVPDAVQITKLLKAHGSTLTNVHLPSPSNTSDPQAPELTVETRTTGIHVPPALFLQLCPNLDTISFSANSPLMGDCSHTTLRRVALYSVRSDKLYPKPSRSKRRNASATSPGGPSSLHFSLAVNHLRSLTRESFPALETVRTAGFLVSAAADSDSQIKDVFISWREHFERDGVDFQDGEGVVWVYE
ncbi:hypothetical protein MIND_00106700 [Mycena indigotica]|uniref:F-box domain-containing protein n=1 Tax=Mycena indigotica TaxID=2126181 RepID=A0A8H6WGJ2_9AGAR|nr:uncharacterized protein MIND_00106700 [Mycena indigotica]KAF7315901.1 hypothetical protein MIND_00106700 [Mycena indigotica]